MGKKIRKVSPENRTDIWVTRDGKRVRFQSVSDTHLKNIIRMALRRIRNKTNEQVEIHMSKMLSCYSYPANGDGAQMAMEQAASEEAREAENWACLRDSIFWQLRYIRDYQAWGYELLRELSERDMLKSTLAQEIKACYGGRIRQRLSAW